MRILFYDYGPSTLSLQYLIPQVKLSGHDPIVFYNPSITWDYLFKDSFLRHIFKHSMDRLADQLIAKNSDIICFSIITSFFQITEELISTIKKHDSSKIIIIGGPHVTLVPEAVLTTTSADFMVVGEGDYTFPTLLRALEKYPLDTVKHMGAGQLPGVWNRIGKDMMRRGVSPITPNLDDLPPPSKELYFEINPALVSIYCTTASRGCYYNCTYCNNNALRKTYGVSAKSYYRLRSVDKVIDELVVAKEKFNMYFVEFYDELFGADRDWIEEFCHRYSREVALPFGITSHPILLDDPIIELLRNTGCACVELGFQSADESYRKKYLHRYEKNEKVEKVIACCRNHGIQVELDFILNLPHETSQNLEALVRFVRKSKPSFVNLYSLQYFPKAEILQIACDEGVVTKDEMERIEQGDTSSIRSSYRPSNAYSKQSASDYRIIYFRAVMALYFSEYVDRIYVFLNKIPIVKQLLNILSVPLFFLNLLFKSIFVKEFYYARWQYKRLFSSVRMGIREKIGRLFCVDT